MPTSIKFSVNKFFKQLGQRGVIHLIPLLILLVGIIAGVYLVQKQQIFKPKAAAETIDILPGDCIKEKDGKKVLVCDRFQFKINSPLETGRTSDAGPNISLVKTAYAAGSGTGYYCKDDKSKIYHKTNNCTLVLNLCTFDLPVVGHIGYEEASEDCEEGSKCVTSSFLNTGIAPTAECVKQPGQQPAVVGPGVQVGPSICYSQQKANVNGDKTKDCFICQGDTIVGVRPNGTQYNQRQCVSGESCQAINPGDLISDVDCLPETTVLKPPPPRAVTPPAGVPAAGAPAAPTSLLAKCEDNPSTLKQGERPQGYSWVADCAKSCTKNSDCPQSTDGNVNKTTSNWCYDFQEGLRCMMLKYTATVAPASERVTTCKEKSKTWDQIDAELRGARYDGAFDHSQAELDAYNRAACPAAPGVGVTAPQAPATQRSTIKFRLAANLADLERAPWYDYTSGGVTVNAPSPYYSIGSPKLNETYSIFVQFMDNQNQTIKFPNDQTYAVKSIQFVDYASIRETASPSPAGGGPAAAAASCGSVIMASGNGNPGGNGAVQLAYTGNPAKVQVWMASNDSKDKSANKVTSWTKVSDTTASSYVTFTIPQGMTFGSHAVLVSLHDTDGNMLDGNPGDPPQVNPKCASYINIQSQDTTKPPAETPSVPSGQTFSASCKSVSAIGSGSAGGVGTVNLDYSGNPVYTQVWIASNDAIGKSAGKVGNNWTLSDPNHPYPPATKGLVSFNIPSSVAAGSHAILVALFDPQLNMLDGNPGGTVNSACTSTISIQ